ncbi:MAG: ATP-binding protein [Oculatellaceae cyanobacterium Prado106]|jgi:signal transduction histidine kinase|nr:ATP-binding protein [Oculatellaceae cyanobacterium Prado106]
MPIVQTLLQRLQSSLSSQRQSSFWPLKRSGNSTSLQKIPLQTLLVTSFVLQIFLAVGLVGYFSWRNSQKAVNELANQLMDEVNSRIDLQLQTYLSIPPKINQIHANNYKLGLLDLENVTSLERYFWYEANEFETVSFHIFGNERGDYVGIERLDNNERQIVASDLKNGYRVYATDNEGDRTQLLRTVANQYDPRQRPWYKAAVEAGKPTWGKIYVWFKNQKLGIPAVQPVYDAKGKLVGVFGTELALSQISDFLNTLNLGETGQTFIIERSGMMVASSSNEKPFRPSADGKSYERLDIAQSKDHLSTVTAQYLRRYFGDYGKIQKPQQIKFELNQEWNYLRVTPFRDRHGLDWLVVVVIPESNFMNQINANTRTTLLLCAAALTVAIAFGIYTSKRVTRSIHHLSQASEALAARFGSLEGNEEQVEQRVKGSWIQEIHVLAQSFNRMAQGLQDSFLNLEQNNQTLEQVNAALETRVEHRTAQLKLAKEMTEEKNAQLQQLTEQLEQRVTERTEELTQALENLQHSQMQLIQSEKMSSLGQLVAGVAHEINNPVGFIYGNLNPANRYIEDLLHLLKLYQEHYPDPEAAIQKQIKNIELDFVMQDLPKIFASMKIGAERIQQIVLSLKTFSRMDEAEMKAVDIHDGIDSTLVIVQNRLKAQKERLDIEVIKNYGDLPLVECYPGQLNQVFMNILVNAIDACEDRDRTRAMADMEEEPSRITITTEITDQDRVLIRFSDNATGISEAVQKRLFDPFFTTKPVGQGTGLGMSISYQIVTERHGGILTCVSEVGVGTEFRVEIPRNQKNQLDIQEYQQLMEKSYLKEMNHLEMSTGTLG